MLERQRLLNSTHISDNLKTQVERWRDAAKRSMKLGEGKADVMEELDDMKIKFRAAAHVAEKWRNPVSYTHLTLPTKRIV